MASLDECIEYVNAILAKNAWTCIKFNVNTYTYVFWKDVDEQMDHNSVIVIQMQIFTVLG